MVAEVERAAPAAAVPGGGAPPSGGVARAFWQIFLRDVAVTVEQLPAFLAQVVLQPLFLVFVFGKVLAELNFTRPGYADLLLPGVIALTCVLTGVQGTALPLVIDFSFSREIEDRLLAPLPAALVAVEKIVFGAARSLIAAAVMFPVGLLVLGHIPFRAHYAYVVVIVMVLGSLVGAAMGLTLGTLVQPQQINIVFALTLTPLLFTGASQYPWPSLTPLLWFKIVTLFNPLTYVSEGLRGAMIPTVGHIPVWISILVLLATTAGFTAAGVWGFVRRAVD